MPRGSKPGERRGGRQRGTPNKKTVLKNTVLCAVAIQPNASPLDFMLGLMRDPKVATDLRIDMAATAAPFVHPRLKGPPKIRLNRFGANGDFSVRRMEGVLTPGGPGAAGGGDFTPLGFLLSVMNDPDATPQQRIRAARVAARYKHAQANADEASIVIEDKFGFKIDPVLARSIRADWLRDKEIMTMGISIRLHGNLKGTAEEKAINREMGQMKARAIEHKKALQAVECPAGYTVEDAEEDMRRLEELFDKHYRHSQKLTREEDVEQAHITARVAACEANEAPACGVIRELRYRPRRDTADTPLMRAIAEFRRREQAERESGRQ
jgi:hypothetical protein